MILFGHPFGVMFTESQKVVCDKSDVRKVQ